MTFRTNPFTHVVLVLASMFAPVALQAATGDEFSDRTSCFPSLATQGLNGPSIQRVAARPSLDTSVRSANGRFRIHFDRRGTNAVAPADADLNGIPDYVDSVAYYLDYVYDVEVVSMGYAAPLRYAADSSAWDVYVMEIGNEPGAVIDGITMSGYYGLTYPVDARNKPCGSGLQHSAAFLVLDNNYSITDSVMSGGTRKRVYRDTGVIALKVTIAHEFHHMIQFGYTASLPTVMINEMCGVWMEHRVFPESNDYLQYAKPLFNSTDTRYWTDGDNATTAGYAHAFFFQYLQETSRETIVRNMWERFGECEINVFRALDSAARLGGISLSGLWNRCLPWLYGTAYRASTYSSFSNAAFMPVLVPFNDRDCEYTDPSLTVNVGLRPFQFRLLRCVLPGTDARAADTMDLLCTNSNTAAAIASSRTSVNVGMIVSKNMLPGARPIGSTPYFLHLDSDDSSHVRDTLFLTDGFVVKQGTSPFPQPYSLRSQDALWFPLAPSISQQKKLVLNIMSVDGVLLYSAENEVVADPERRVRALQWRPSTTTISSGVYIYTIEASGDTYTGSFLIEP